MDPEPITTNEHSRNVALDGLRAVAVLMVIVHHYAGKFGRDGTELGV
jgi:peptidoglycan/LPS O-acetylase OafA/YrhL